MPEQPGKNAIEVRGVRKVFGTGENQVAALDTVSVSIRENEFFTLLGPSGCGKTTLLRLIAGFDFPTAGEILLHGRDIAPLPPFKRPVNTVFQSYALFPHMTVAQNIGFGLEMLGKPKGETEARVAQMLKLVKMEALKARRTSQISGGQQQRVALARALAPQPKVLLLDEPLSALDYKLRKEMQIELKRLQNETGITFIFVTHDQEEALTMSDRIAVMSAGKILQVGTPRDIYDRPAERFVADFIGETNFLPGTVVSKKPGVATVKFASNATIAAGYPEGFDPTGEVTLVVRPEHADLVPDPAKGTVAGTLSNIVYFGTDTHYHVKLDGGENFIVRHQNSRSAPVTYETGAKVGIQFEEDAARVLKD
ncbi:ABC transporter ATP-binding protein [Mesorhizobium sp. B3-1-9]|uniref:ABC transporter ATP-binding protein n=1 Tax=unclassified Mesorhizobium TaxID=325217 RepID=UPI00112A96D8|nr:MULTISPECIES: ABC transporter ATP-binding protein [unclassified Mesorhizobium]TPI25488.1 ABC transporter ATP-binding protein [Mesorhizobium sp. B3-1-6]TPI30862.1 ABC transporter ATP-binding protein [Mesorhizobium sp. B3-1-9]TPI60213.1 ABC transporter ATP-binding protein [Mesorhizobium sp. B3-1-7]TPI66329.1 ABC transporter ATP-binding protein [Mesorhizobium sp. B3-1-8]TPI73134.1 ABC transporter ATP-binding protein [Mesorhizobium sp. B3-1-3]